MMRKSETIQVPPMFWMAIFLFMCLTASISFNFFQFLNCSSKSHALAMAMAAQYHQQSPHGQNQFEKELQKGLRNVEVGQRISPREGGLRVGDGGKEGGSHGIREDSKFLRIQGSQAGKEQRREKLGTEIDPKAATSRHFSHSNSINPGQWVNVTGLDQGKKILLDLGANCGVYGLSFWSDLRILHCFFGRGVDQELTFSAILRSTQLE